MGQIKPTVPYCLDGGLVNAKPASASLRHVELASVSRHTGSVQTHKATRRVVSMVAHANFAISSKSVPQDRASTNSALATSASKKLRLAKKTSAKMTIPIADRTAKTAIHLPAMSRRVCAIPRGIAKPQHANVDSTYTITPAK